MRAQSPSMRWRPPPTSAWKGVPGLGFCVARKDALEACKGNAHSLSLDLHDQWVAMEKNAQYRFTPPVQAIASFHQAIEEFRAEGGVAGRGGRYTENCKVLVDGMRRLGFETLLPDDLQAPIIVTFLTPGDPNFLFEAFYDKLSRMGLRHLSWQTHRCQHVPDRVHRPPRYDGN